MRVWLWLLLALASFGIARGARVIAEAQQSTEAISEPYAPTPGTAPYVSLGYREAAADFLFVRLRTYFGDVDASPETVADLCEAIVVLDQRFHRPYEFCAGAISFFALTDRRHGSNALYRRAIALLDRGMAEYPNDWHLPNLAAQIYTQDLKTDDPAQRREWDEKATLLIESAVRKPGAPAELQEWAAVMRTKYGQQQRAIRDLHELLLVTSDKKAQRALIQRLAQLEHQDADAIAREVFEARHIFDEEWRNQRPSLPASWYVLLGPRLAPTFDPVDLATGGHDLMQLQTPQPDEPPPE